MSQSRKHSAIETIANITIGWAIGLIAQILIFPAFGIHESFGTNLAISSAFTVVSIARSYCIRRLFNSWRSA